MVALTLDDQGLTVRLDRLSASLQKPSELLGVLGREARRIHVAHFRAKNRSEPNRLGGKRTNFWTAVAASVHQPVLDAGDTRVRVTISHPAFRQKLQGGRISAKRSKALTIPVSKEAYGRTAETLERQKGIRLFLLGRRDGQKRGVLAELSTRKGVIVHYVLKPFVNQQADPAALPPRQSLIDALVVRAQRFLTRQGGVV
jgi:hypothetical protein